jgi:DNA modification methylase
MLTVLHGHSLTKLREMPDESVHCWISSPPYWGLRDYGTPPQVWGGDEQCEHEWGAELNGLKRTGGTRKSGLGNYNNGLSTQAIERKNANQCHDGGSCTFCQKCDAWFGHLGLEPSPELYVRNLVTVLREARRVLRSDGTFWLNLGDTYAGSRSGEKREIPHYDGRDYDRTLQNSRVALEPEQNIPVNGRRVKDGKSKQATNRAADFAAPHRSKRISRGNGRWGGGNNPSSGELKPKDLVGIPWMVAFALRSDGWWLRSAIPWIKRNCMPESTTDRPSTATEHIFLLSKSDQYFYDSDAVAVPASAATHARLSQNLEAQIGSQRANGGVGKTNGNMKAVGRKMAASGSGIKNNESSNDSVCLMVGDRNRRNSDWFFESWRQNSADEVQSWQGMLSDDNRAPLAFVINTQPYSEAHFATFPPKLIHPMILAGTSAWGCCSKCGAPWERNVELGEPDMEHRKACGGDDSGEYNPTGNGKYVDGTRAQNAQTTKQRILAGMVQRKTVGWLPTCECGSCSECGKDRKGRELCLCMERSEGGGAKWVPCPTIPCTVGDMFGGSGTTGEVALELGRNAILIELNDKYLPLIDQRCDVTPGLALA